MGLFDSIKEIGSSIIGATPLGRVLGGSSNPLSQIFGSGEELGILGLGSRPVGSSEFRPQQAAFIQALQAQAEGRAGESPSEILLRQQQEETARGIRSQVASTRGLDPATAARLSSRAASEAGRGAGLSAALLRSREQLQAQSLLGAALGQGRGQDIERERIISGLAEERGRRRTEAFKSFGSVLGSFAGGGGG